MELFRKEDFEKLSQEKGKICASIYIPTHESGIEVNEGVDKILFKNEIQKIKEELEKRNLQDKEIAEFLDPAYQLLDDTNFWRYRSNGLAVFIKEKGFWSFTSPISFKEWSEISPMFDLTPLLPLLTEEDNYYTLALSQNKIKLFRNTSFTYEEIDISQLVPENSKEVLSDYDFSNEEKEKNVVREGLKRTPGQGPLPSRAGAPQDNSYKYVTEFLRYVNNGVAEVLKGEKAPLVIAAVDNLQALYRQVNTYKNLTEKGIEGNPDYVQERVLHEKSYHLVKNQLNKSRKNDIEKYSAWAGTGKTSHDLQTILNAAYEGKIESIFLIEGMYTWGIYHEAAGKVEIHKDKQPDDISLLSLLSAKTIENNGKAYLVTDSEMPEKSAPANVAAIFRY